MIIDHFKNTTNSLSVSMRNHNTEIITNPILPGFNPDPSIIRVGENYYIATSTFEWFPGVQIHHSTDLVNWELIARPLNRVSQLDLIGNPDSCGVWAPCLSYDQGTFYLVYSNVRSFDGSWKDTPNFLVTTDDIRGDWSEPIFLSASGFDGSMFHDPVDGRKWYTSLLVDHRKGKFFGGIILQEYDPAKKKLVGPVFDIFTGSELGITEGPHLYRKNDYYYLITAEGGTEYGHAVTIARAKSIQGPYQLHPNITLVTSRDHPELPLQKAGHGDLVETRDGEWLLVFLVGRPLTSERRCMLGRETAMELVEWRDDDWPYLKSGLPYPRVNVPIAQDSAAPIQKQRYHEEHRFDIPELSIHFQALRIPMEDSWLSLTDRPGYLRLYGKESLSSFHRQSLIARRIQHFAIEVSTVLEFEPANFQQMAGLVFYYNTSHWIYLHLMGGEEGQNKLLQIITCDNFEMKEALEDPVEIGQGLPVSFKAIMQKERLQFYFATDPSDDWRKIGPVIDASILSDDYVRDGADRYRPAFTGAFVGLCCQDLTGNSTPCDFKFFTYHELAND